MATKTAQAYEVTVTISVLAGTRGQASQEVMRKMTDANLVVTSVDVSRDYDADIDDDDDNDEY